MLIRPGLRSYPASRSRPKECSRTDTVQLLNAQPLSLTPASESNPGLERSSGVVARKICGICRILSCHRCKKALQLDKDLATKAPKPKDMMEGPRNPSAQCRRFHAAAPASSFVQGHVRFDRVVCSASREVEGHVMQA